MNLLRPLAFVSALLCMTGTLRAAPAPDTAMSPANPAPDDDKQRVPLGDGRVLTVSHAAPLSFGAGVGDVLYQPGSLKAAYAGAVTRGNTLTTSVKLVGLRTGQTWTLMQHSTTVPGKDTPFYYQLIGWSGDGRYLVIAHTEQLMRPSRPLWPEEKADMLAEGLPLPKPGELEETAVIFYDSVNVGAEPFTVRRIALPDGVPEEGDSATNFMASPSGKRFALDFLNLYAPGDNTPTTVFVYDPATDAVQRINFADGGYLWGWQDDTHLRMGHSNGKATTYRAHDILTGKETPSASIPPEPAPPARAYPEVRLSLSVLTLAIPGPNGKQTADGLSLWLSVTGKKPHLPAVCLAVTRDVPLVRAVSAPAKIANRCVLAAEWEDMRAVLAPDQSSALCVDNGDLYASTFAVERAPK